MGGNPSYMRKLRLSLLLPSVQLVIAVVMWESDGRLRLARFTPGRLGAGPLISYGINAPAVFMKLVVFPLTRGYPTLPQVSLFGYGLEEISFFVGVAILWFFVGWWLDRLRRREGQSEAVISLRKATLAGFFVVLSTSIGLGLLVEGVRGLQVPFKWGDYWGTIVESCLFLVWSSVLLVACGVETIRLLRILAHYRTSSQTF